MDYINSLRKEVDSIFAATATARKEMFRYRKLYEGDLWRLSEPEFSSFEKSNIQINTIFSNIQAIIPLITDNRPIAQVTPVYPFLEKMGQALNNVTKYWWQAGEIPDQLHTWVLDAMTCRYGVAKVWHDPSKRWGCKYRLDVIDPIDFFIAPGYTDPWDAPYCGVRAMKPVSWVKEHFPNAKKVVGDKSSESESDKEDRQFKFSGSQPSSGHAEFVEVTEVFIRDDDAMEDIVEEDGEGKKRKRKQPKYPHGKYCWFTPGMELGEEAARDEHGLPPYVIYRCYKRPHDFTGISVVELIEGLHKDANLILKYFSDYIRMYHNQNEIVDISGGSFDVDAYKESRARGGQVFTYDSMGGQRQMPVSSVGDPQLNPDMTNMLSFLPNLIEEATGVTDITKGHVSKKERQSAVEIGILHETSHTRVRQMIRNLESSLSRVYYLFLRNLMQYQQDPEYFSFREASGTGYQMYGNSTAQADDTLRPQMDKRSENVLAWSKRNGIPITNPDDVARIEEYERDLADYEKFLEWVKGPDGEERGEFDPVFFDFHVEIQDDSMLPTDRQAKANLIMRMAQLAPEPAQLAMYELALTYLQVPNAHEVIKRMREVEEALKQQSQGSPPGDPPQMSEQDRALAEANPEEFERYQQEVQRAEE